MFCPLCKAEYRQGFTECSDCHVTLVSSQAEAAAAAVDRVWKGEDRQQCNRILDRLIVKGIPFHSKELIKAQPWPWLSILFFRFMRPRPTFELEVSVLHGDLERAGEACRDAIGPAA